MTNETKKRHYDKYRDPFEIHRLQSEANVKKMRMERRLNVFNGNAINSGTTPVTLKLSREFRKTHVLSDKTNMNSLNPSLRYRKENLIVKPKVTISGMRDSIIAMHRKPSGNKTSIQKCPPDNPNKISIFTLSSIIKNTKFTTNMKNGGNDRLLEIWKDIVKYTPFERINITKGSILLQAHLYAKRFVEWFKINKFDYILVDKDLEALRAIYNSEKVRASIKMKNTSVDSKQKEGMVDQLSKQRYIRHEQYKKASNPSPTHIVQTYKRVGKFMSTAKVKDIQTNETSVVLLLRTDIRFKVDTNDLLILMDKSCTTHLIDNKKIPVYMNWQIYRERPIDIDFFS